MIRTKTWQRVAVVATAVLGMTLTISACGGDESDPSPTPTTAASESPTTASGVPSPMPGTLTPTSPAGSPVTTPPSVPSSSRTGEPELDAVIGVIASGGAASIVPILESQRVACTTAQGAGGPPKCAQGEANGTQVTVFPHAGCEVSLVRGEAFQPVFAELTSQPEAKSAFELTSDTANVLGAKKAIVFEVTRNGTKAGLLVAVNEQGKITGTWAGCGNVSAADLLTQHKGGTVYLQ